MEDNKLYEDGMWRCPWCNYSKYIGDDLGVHMIANHDEVISEAGIHGTNKLGPDENLKITAKLEPQEDEVDNDE